MTTSATLVELTKMIQRIVICFLCRLSLALGFSCLNLNHQARSSLPFTKGESPSTTFVRLSDLQFSYKSWKVQKEPLTEPTMDRRSINGQFVGSRRSLSES
uniref:Uncharacterized protein n=1 Tax=Solanum tuberosum TaxID=4113 RepID=M1DY03_SOLTU